MDLKRIQKIFAHEGLVLMVPLNVFISGAFIVLVFGSNFKCKAIGFVMLNGAVVGYFIYLATRVLLRSLRRR